MLRGTDKYDQPHTRESHQHRGMRSPAILTALPRNTGCPQSRPLLAAPSGACVYHALLELRECI